MESLMSDSETLIRGEVAKARRAIMEVARAHGAYRWRPADLRAAARNGGNPGALGIALDDLIEAGELFQSDNDQRIGLPEPSGTAS